MKARTVVGRGEGGGGEKSLPSDPGSELLTSREGERERKNAKTINGMSKNKRKENPPPFGVARL